MTDLEELVRGYIRDLVFPMLPSEEAVKATIAQVEEVMRPWQSASAPPLTQNRE